MVGGTGKCYRENIYCLDYTIWGDFTLRKSLPGFNHWNPPSTQSYNKHRRKKIYTRDVIPNEKGEELITFGRIRNMNLGFHEMQILVATHTYNAQ